LMTRLTKSMARADDDKPQTETPRTGAEVDAEVKLLSDSMVSARSDD